MPVYRQPSPFPRARTPGVVPIFAGPATPITSTGTGGAYGSGSSWVGGVVPSSTDRIVIADGATITVSDHRTLGTSPAKAVGVPTVWDLDIAPTGKLVIAGTGSLTLRGYGRNQTGGGTGEALIAVDLLDGAAFEFDSSLAPTPATDGYDWYCGTSLWNYRGWRARGNVEIRSVAGSAWGRLKGPTDDNEPFICDLDGNGTGTIRLTRLGRSNAECGLVIGGGPGDARVHVRLIDAIASDVWGLVNEGGNLSTAHDYTLRRLTFVNAPAGLAYQFRTQGTGTPVLDDCAFSGIIWPSGSVTACSLLGDYEIGGVRCGTWDDNLVQTGGALSPAATLNREYRITTRAASNPKMLSLYSGTTDATDCVFDPIHTETGDIGEFVATNQAPAATTNTLTRPVFLPLHDGRALRWVEFNHDTAMKVVVNHGTGGAYQANIGFGHTGDTGVTTDRAELRNSICADFGDAGGVADKAGPITVDYSDAILPANAHHNCGHRLAASRYPSAQGTGYLLKQSNTALAMGTGDVDVDPWPHWSATPATRRGQVPRLSSWARTVLGLSGTDAQVEDAALAAIHARHVPTDPAYLAAATPAGLHAWVRAGWAPSNAALATAASDGTTIGAVAYAAVAVPPKYLFLRVGSASTLGLKVG